jgi:hypothetical protein
MTYFLFYVVLVMSFVCGFVLNAYLRNAREASCAVDHAERSSQPPNKDLKHGMGKSLVHVGMLLQSNTCDYVSGGLMVSDINGGYINVKGDLMLRMKPKNEEKRSFIGQATKSTNST